MAARQGRSGEVAPSGTGLPAHGAQAGADVASLGCFHGPIVSKNWSSIHPSAVHIHLPPNTLEETDPGWQSASRSSALHQRRRCRDDSNGFQPACSSRHSNHFPTKAPWIELSTRRETGTILGDRGSQVRVLSPRRTHKLISVQGFPGPSMWLNPAGTSPHLRIDDFSSKTSHRHEGTGSVASEPGSSAC